MAKIYNITGDLLDFPEGIRAIAHGCNTQNVMGAGIAAQIRKRYPCAWSADLAAAEAGTNSLGEVSIGTLDDGRRIFNLYQQKNLGFGALVPWALKAAMERMFSLCGSLGISKVGLPYLIGCGLAGGDWSTVYSNILISCKNFDGDLYIVERK